MTSAPCARLTMLRMPQTRLKPIATATYTPPISRPSTTCCTKSCIVLSSAAAPARRRVLRRRVRHVGRPYGVVFAVLDLLDDHRLEGVDAAAVEPDLAEEGRHVESGQGVEQLVRVLASGVLDCLLMCEAGGGGFGTIVDRIVVGVG